MLCLWRGILSHDMQIFLKCRCVWTWCKHWDSCRTCLAMSTNFERCLSFLCCSWFLLLKGRKVGVGSSVTIQSITILHSSSLANIYGTKPIKTIVSFIKDVTSRLADILIITIIRLWFITLLTSCWIYFKISASLVRILLMSHRLTNIHLILLLNLMWSEEHTWLLCFRRSCHVHWLQLPYGYRFNESLLHAIQWVQAVLIMLLKIQMSKLLAVTYICV